MYKQIEETVKSRYKDKGLSAIEVAGGIANNDWIKVLSGAIKYLFSDQSHNKKATKLVAMVHSGDIDARDLITYYNTSRNRQEKKIIALALATLGVPRSNSDAANKRIGEIRSEQKKQREKNDYKRRLLL